jgi:hypothetical protein
VFGLGHCGLRPCVTSRGKCISQRPIALSEVNRRARIQPGFPWVKLVEVNFVTLSAFFWPTPNALGVGRESKFADELQ